MPTLIASYQVLSAGADNTTLVTPAFTPSNGEVIVVKGCTWDTANGLGTPSGGGQSYQQAIVAAPGGFAGWAAVYVATISGSPGSMTVSWPPGTAGNTRHSMVVERWSGAKLAATPAVNGTVHGTGSFSTALVAVANNSIISWCMSEENSVDPSTRSYLLSATEDGIYDGHVGSNSVHYFAYASVGAAGSYNFGLSAPTGLNWTSGGVEVQAGTATQSFDSAVSESVTVTPSAFTVKPVDTNIGATATITATEQTTKPLDSSCPVAAVITATASVIKPFDVSIPISANINAGEPAPGSIGRLISQSTSGRIISQSFPGRIS